jgi:glycosyltransferase involved in cell wall biosynthesis
VLIRDNVQHIEDYFQAADVGLVTSDSESFCLSILEAMCFACPSVSTRVGGIPEVIRDGETGRLVPAGNSEAVARALEDLINDPSLRRSMGLAAQRDAEARFSADAIVPQYERLYARLTGNCS